MFLKRLLFLVIFLAAGLFAQSAGAQEKDRVVGYHDGSNCEIGARGWVKDLNIITPLKVGIWLDWPADSVLTKKVGETTANLLRVDLPFSDQYHGFQWKLSEELRDRSHQLYVYALSPEGEPQKLLNRSGREINCGFGELLSPGTHIQIRKTGLGVYAGPGFDYQPIRDIWGRRHKLREGVILKINKEMVFDEEGNTWYGVTGDIWNRYGSGRWFIPADPWYIKEVDFQKEITVFNDTTEKWIEIDLSEQTLRAFEKNREGEDRVALETLVSTGIYNSTRKGVFKIRLFRIHSYMKGWDYDLPGVPFDMYFDGPRAIHGAYWHNSFGNIRSHGCVNLPLDNAEWLWYWVDGKPLKVVVI